MNTGIYGWISRAGSLLNRLAATLIDGVVHPTRVGDTAINKKADAAEYPGALRRIGLLVNGPFGSTGLPFSESFEIELLELYGSPRVKQTNPGSGQGPKCALVRWGRPFASFAVGSDEECQSD